MFTDHALSHTSTFTFERVKRNTDRSQEPSNFFRWVHLRIVLDSRELHVGFLQLIERLHIVFVELDLFRLNVLRKIPRETKCVTEAVRPIQHLAVDCDILLGLLVGQLLALHLQHLTLLTELLVRRSVARLNLCLLQSRLRQLGRNASLRLCLCCVSFVLSEFGCLLSLGHRTG